LFRRDLPIQKMNSQVENEQKANTKGGKADLFFELCSEATFVNLG
jgi:hypothetical protein